MSTAWIPPRRSYHLRVFAICLALVVIALVGFLFGVQLEAIRPAIGVIQARNLHEIRAPIGGLIEYEGGSKADKVDAKPYRPGDIILPGQPIARIQAEELTLPTKKLQAPDGESWLVIRTVAVPHQAVKPGDVIMVLVSADAQTGKAKDLVAELEIAESHAADVAVGQPVRIYSNMYAQRIHGHADGRIERIDPLAVLGAAGERKFRATAIITQAPFPLHLGSGLRAEIVVGKKQVYKIILEQ